MPIALLGWKALQRNSLRGFATVRIGRSLSIKDVGVYSSKGRQWASLPSKPVMASDGTARRSDDGKIQYVPVLEWIDRDSANRFSAAVIEAVEREYPGATK